MQVRIFDLLDVRQPEEWQIGKIPRACLVPLDTLTAVLSQFDSARDIVGLLPQRYQECPGRR